MSIARRLQRTARKAVSIALVLALTASTAMAQPQGGTVTSGGATITTTGANTVINQATGQAIINWNSFSIGPNETVQFLQPSALATALNRVTGIDPSVILG